MPSKLEVPPVTITVTITLAMTCVRRPPPDETHPVAGSEHGLCIPDSIANQMESRRPRTLASKIPSMSIKPAAETKQVP